MNSKTENRTQVFAYKGVVGIYLPDDAPAVCRASEGILGCMVRAKTADFTQEAFDILSQIPASRAAVGNLDTLGAADDIIFGWLGGSRLMLRITEDITGADTWDPELLRPFITQEDILVPDNFLYIVDAEQPKSSEE